MKKISIISKVKSYFALKLIAALLFGVAAQVSFMSGNVSATSDYDNIVQLAETLHLSRNGTTQGSPACSPVDTTTQWQSVLNDDTAWWSGTQYVGGATRENAQADFETALGNDTGWAVSQLSYSDSSVTGTGSDSIAHAVRVVFSPSDTAYVDFSTFQGQKYAAMRNTDGAPVYAVIIQFHDPDGGSSSNACTPLVTQSIRESGVGDGWFLETKGVAGRPTDDTYVVEPLSVNAAITYPTGYNGVQFPNDIDGDGLIATKEATQSTSDTNNDTDNDGLNDYVESQWYANRQAVFCGTSCVYPDPTGKDIYVEVDWMNDGNQNLKPSSTQLAAVVDMFDSQGVALHFDTGQHGGGNVLPSYISDLYFEQNSGQFDFYDYKNGTSTTSANFGVNRKHIWHYMISGYEYHDIEGSSGASYPGDDDTFISYGLISDNPGNDFDYNDVDTAISGTIAHELGHTLCLTSNSSYVSQAAECIDSKIDTWTSSDYDSVMNYTTQMFMTDYSGGLNGSPNDHNDWSAVLGGGIADFSEIDRNFGDAAGMGGKDKKPKKLVRGITRAEAKVLKQAGKLGGKYKNN